MRGAVLGLVGIVCLAGCDADASADAGIDAATRDGGASDAGPPPTLACESAEPGCVGACQIMVDCVVQSGQRDSLADPLRGYGFLASDWDDCSRCTARCEADTTSDGDDARACFAMHYEAAFCGGAPDPTQAANALDACCEGRGGSRFCVDSCNAILGSGSELLASLIPNCVEIAGNDLREPTCAGACPAVTEAIHLPVTGDATWRPQIYAVHTDGSVAVTGYFEAGTIDLGAGPHTATSRTQFVAVFDPDGTPRWSRALSSGGAGSSAWGQRTAFDAGGNLTVAGELFGTLDLGAGEMTSAGSSDALVARFAPDGTLLWARSFGGSEADLVHAVDADGTGLLVAVEFRGTSDLGFGPHVSEGESDILVVRFDAAGAPVWSRAAGGGGIEIPWGLAVHPSGDYTVVGGASDGADFGAGPITSAGDQDGFVARFAPDGALRWLHQFGGPNWEIAYQVAADGEAAVIGDYLNDDAAGADFGGTSIDGRNQPLARIEADGSFAWVNDNPQIVYEDGFALWGVHVSAGGRIEVSAQTSNPSCDLGGGPHAAYPSNDMVVGSFDANGAHRWSLRLGGPLLDGLSRLVRLPSGETILVGEMLDQLDYGPGELIGEGRDLFLLRFAD